MSITLMTAAFKTALPSTQKFVLVALCDSANDQGECYPSIRLVAEKCSLGERTVQEAIGALEVAGYVRREFRTGRSTVYWLSTTPAAAAPRANRTPQQPHPTPADCAPQPPQIAHPTPAAAAPITVTESSVEPSKKRKGVGTRLPDAWVPTETDLAYAAGKGVDAEVEAENFRDHWLADTTAKAVKADWAAAWRTWCRNSIRFGAERKAASGGKSFRQQDAEAARAAASAWSGGLLGGDPNTIDMEQTHGLLTHR